MKVEFNKDLPVQLQCIKCTSARYGKVIELGEWGFPFGWTVLTQLINIPVFLKKMKRNPANEMTQRE